MTQTGGREAEAVVDLLPGLVDHVHAVGGVLLPTHGPGGRSVRLIETRLAFVETLLYLHRLSVFVIVDDKHIFSLNVSGFLGIHCGLSVVTSSSLFHQIRIWSKSRQDLFTRLLWFVIKNSVSDKFSRNNLIQNFDVTRIILYLILAEYFPIGTRENGFMTR